jgi:hypothetical protein
VDEGFGIGTQKFFYTDLIDYLKASKVHHDNYPKNLSRDFNLGSLYHILSDKGYSNYEHEYNNCFLSISSINHVSTIRVFFTITIK